MHKHLFRYAITQFLQQDTPASGGGGTPPAVPAVPVTPVEDVSGLKSALEKEREANAVIKKAATDKGMTVEAYLQSITDGTSSNQSELQKLQQRIDELTTGIETERTNAQTARIESALSTAANNARAQYSDVIVDMLRDRIELDDQGKPKGVAEAVEQLKTDKPGLFRHAEGRGDGGRPPRKESDVKPGVDRLSEYYATESPTAKTG